jgi:hypothetical protein
MAGEFSFHDFMVVLARSNNHNVAPVGNSYSLYERFLGNWYSEGYGLDGRGVGV